MGLKDFMGKAKNSAKPTDEKELVANLHAICEELHQKGHWNASWFTQNQIALPSPQQEQSESLLRDLETAQQKLDSARKELSTTIADIENAKNKQAVILQDVHEEEKKLAELRNSPGNISDKGLSRMQETLQNGVNLILSTLTDKIDTENRELVRVLEKTEDKLMLREADVQSFQEDLFRKSTTPYLKQFIALGDMMRKLVAETTENEKPSNTYLHEQIQKLIESIDYILRDFSVEVYKHIPEEVQFNPQNQEVVAYCPTDNSELDRKVRRTINPGYIWTLPYILKAKANGEQLPLKEYSAIFRREQVECYKLN